MGTRLEARSTEIRKRIEKHTFDNEEGEEYGESAFGGFGDYFRRKKIKLQNLDAEIRASSGNPAIFRGVVVHINGYTQPSLNDLHHMIVSHGGGFIQYLDGKTMVTHIIASNLTPKKKVEFARYRIVKPAWVVESIGAGKLLPWSAYRLLDEGPEQRVLGFENGKVVSQLAKRDEGYKGQTDASLYTKELAAKTAQHEEVDPIETELQELIKPIESPSTKQAPLFSQEQSATKYAEGDSPSPSLQNGRTLAIDDTNLVDRKEKDEKEALYEDIDPADIPAVNASFTSSAIGTQEQKELSYLEKVYQAKSILNNDDVDIEESGSEISEPNINYDNDDNINKALAYIDDAKRSIDMNSHEMDSRTDGILNDNNELNKRPESPPREMSAEEHNAALIADPNVWKSTVVNPGFLKQYYEESRLHHLSAWKAALKSQLQAMAAEKSASQKVREKRDPRARQYILHVDFDSFFAAVSLRKHPHLVDKPVVIAHGNGAGAEIASSNYPARKFGIKNGMWMKHAQRLCPGLKVLPYDFKAYEDASRSFYEAILDTGGVVQSVSVDEALLDVSEQCNVAGGHEGKGIHEGSIWREQGKADEIAGRIRSRIQETVGCAVSVGIGGNILLAKVALRQAKPAGQYQIKPEDALKFLGDLTMQDLPGIAWSIGGKLEEIGVKFVKDVRQLSKEKMMSVLGPKTGEKVWNYSRGIDYAEVGDQVIRKSVSAEVNWGIRFVTQEQVDEFIQSLADELHKRLLNESVKGRQLTMKIMRRAADAPLDPPKHLGHGKCDTFNKSVVLGVCTNDSRIIGREALSILKGFGFSPGELRGLGIQMQKLEPIRSRGDVPLESSQRRLQFGTPTPKKSMPKQQENDSLERNESIAKGIDVAGHQLSYAMKTKGDSSDITRSPPLNITGTQFALPSQVDPEILKELPDEIRTKLIPGAINAGTKRAREPSVSPRLDAYTATVSNDAMPSLSQLDEEALQALPEDVREEVLSFYSNAPHLRGRDQALLPQSPRKDRMIKLPKKLTTPTKKRIRASVAHSSKSANVSNSTLTQANFIANTHDVSDSLENGEISAEVLQELPEDIRQEVLEQARHDRLQRKGGIDVAARKKRDKSAGPTIGNTLRTLALPERPAKPSFTARKLTDLPDLRESISAWVEEFVDEGPYQEDVNALVSYLGLVVLEERDMEKAIAVAKWLAFVVEQADDNTVSKVWRDTVKQVREGVEKAVKQRGLGGIAFG